MLYVVNMDGLTDLRVRVKADSAKEAEAKIFALNLAPWSAQPTREVLGDNDQEIAPGVFIGRGGGLLEPLLKLFNVPKWVPTART